MPLIFTNRINGTMMPEEAVAEVAQVAVEEDAAEDAGVAEDVAAKQYRI